MKPILAALALILAAAPALAQQGNPGAHFLENWDTDGDGRVTLAEAESRRGDVFAAFDADEDGALRGAEYDLFDQARAQDQQGQGHGAGYGPADRGMERGFNDRDGDGAITATDFGRG